MTDEYGEVLEDGSLKFVRRLPGPIERVWSWVVDAEKRAQWFCAGAWPCEAGAPAEFHFRHADLTPHDDRYPEKYKAMEKGVKMSGEVLACDPPHLIRLRWDDDGVGASEVTITLTEDGEAVRLELIDKRIGDADQRLGVLAGWHGHLDIMADKLSGRTPKPFWNTHEALIEDYRRRGDLAAP